MFHNLKIERLFNLGDYKNIKIIAETVGIPDEFWDNPEVMDRLRLQLNLETFMNLALHQEMSANNSSLFENRDWSLIYERFRSDRHQEELVPDLSEVTIDEI